MGINILLLDKGEDTGKTNLSDYDLILRRARHPWEDFFHLEYVDLPGGEIHLDPNVAKEGDYTGGKWGHPAGVWIAALLEKRGPDRKLQKKIEEVDKSLSDLTEEQRNYILQRLLKPIGKDR